MKAWHLLQSIITATKSGSERDVFIRVNGKLIPLDHVENDYVDERKVLILCYSKRDHD